MRCRARWPRRWRPCATSSATSSCGRGCSGSPTTRRSRGCASAARWWTSMRSARWGRDSLAQTLEDRERLALLRADLRDLPERQRMALVLRELSGLSHEEIAGVLDSSARAVKQTIFEARAGLQECAEGRTMLCADVQRALSDGDGRVLRGRRMRAHVRSCRACRQFKTALAQRPADLAAAGAGAPADGRGGAAGPSASRGQGRTGGERGQPPRGAGGGVVATVATKAAIVAVAAATLAGTGTVVRDDVTARDRAHGRPATRLPPRRTRPASAPASLRPATASGAAGSVGRGSDRSRRRRSARPSAPSHRRRPRRAGGRRAHRRRPPSSRPGAKGQANGAGQAAGGRGATAVAPGPRPPRSLPPTRRRPADGGTRSQGPPRAPGASRVAATPAPRARSPPSLRTRDAPRTPRRRATRARHTRRSSP